MVLNVFVNIYNSAKCINTCQCNNLLDFHDVHSTSNSTLLSGSTGGYLMDSTVISKCTMGFLKLQ